MIQPEEGQRDAGAQGASLSQRRWVRLAVGVGLVMLGTVLAVANVVVDVPIRFRVGWGWVVLWWVLGALPLLEVSGKLRRWPRGLVSWGEGAWSTVAIAAVIRATLVQSFWIPSGSMLPTMQVGDFVVATKVPLGIGLPYTSRRVLSWREPRRGDVVIFVSPLDDTSHFVKRVLGLPGETIELRDRKLFVDGREAQDPWGSYDQAVSALPSGVKGLNAYGPQQVPPGQYLMVGDNRLGSYDGRFWGFVDADRIEGKVVWTYWSWDAAGKRIRWSRIGRVVR